MFYLIQQYRILISQILIGLYLLGAIQGQLLEVVHLFSHALSSHEHGGFHSLADHVNNDAHTLLTMFNADSNEQDKNQNEVLLPIEKIECFNGVEEVVVVNNVYFTRPIHPIQIRPDVNLDILSPPPKYTS